MISVAQADKADLAVGQVVTLRVTWGTQSRLRCPACQRYMAACRQGHCRCGARYEPVESDGDFVVRSLP